MEKQCHKAISEDFQELKINMASIKNIPKRRLPIQWLKTL